MINIESIKDKIRSLAKEYHLSTQEILQMYFFERFLERLSQSKHRTNFVIKGGLLISSLIGVKNRTTMDMDTTVKGIPLEEKLIKKIVEEIISIENDDGIKFGITGMEHIREEDDYDDTKEREKKQPGGLMPWGGDLLACGGAAGNHPPGRLFQAKGAVPESRHRMVHEILL